MDGAEGQEVTPGTEGVAPEGGSPQTSDQPTATGDTATPEPWDWSEYADRNVTVKVDGQERQVPLRETVDGYMRQADYTQKTQALSEHAKQLSWASTIAQALEANPEQAINILQSQYLGNEPAQEEEFLTDEEREIAELKSWREEQEQREAVRQVEAEVAQLQQGLGEDFFDPNELLNYAIEGNFPNLTTALQSMKFSEVYGEAQAVRDARAQQQQQAQAAEEQRRAAGLVGGGHNVPPGSTQRGVEGERLSVREAWLRAQETHQ